MSTFDDVRRITRAWRHGPPVHVIASHKEFPGRADDCTHAMYHRGEVYLLDGAPADVERLVAHEAVAHHGVRSLLGPRGWSDFMLAVRAGARDGDPKLHMIEKRTRQVYGLLRPKLEADEMVAKLAEIRVDIRTGKLRIDRPLLKRWAALRARLARELLQRSVPATMEEIEGVLLESEGLIWDGRCPTVPWWRWYCRGMTGKPMGPARPARSWEEAKRLYEASDKRKDAWNGFLAFLLVLLLVIGLPLWAWSVFSGLLDLLHMIFWR